MTLYVNTAEGGTNGTTLSSGNSGGGSGDAFNTVSGTSSNLTIFSNEQVLNGSLSYKSSPNGVTGTYYLWNEPTPSNNFTTRFYCYLTGYPSADIIWISVQTAAAAVIASLNMNSTGNLKLGDSTGNLVTFTNPIPLNTWCRVTLYGNVATTATITGSLYNGHSLTPIETQTRNTANTGTAQTSRTIFGKLTAGPTMAPYYTDDISQDLQSLTELGPSVSPGAAWTIKKFARLG